MTYIVIKGDELYHHGIKGMKWGVRRYQNVDGSLKAAGRKRYTEGGKKQLTDEERAARNAKIKKAAIAVGATAAVAVGAYVATKYYKTTLSEAKQSLREAAKESKWQYDKDIDRLLQQASERRKASAEYYRNGSMTSARMASDSGNKYGVQAALKKDSRKDYFKAIDSASSSKDSIRKAQRAVVARDINRQKAYMADKYRGHKLRRGKITDADFDAYALDKDMLNIRNRYKTNIRRIIKE